MNTSERLARLEERIEYIIAQIEDIKDNHLKTLYQKLDRPSWFISWLITFLTAIIVLLIRGMIK